MIASASILGLALGVASAAVEVPAQPAGGCANDPSSNRKVVTDFYTMALVRKQVRAGFEQYVRPDFIEHKPDVAGGGREHVIQFLEAMVKELPDARWTILRTIAEGDLVALHARFTPAEGAPDYAIADFFRLEDCRIVEHWDVVGPPPQTTVNQNPRF